MRFRHSLIMLAAYALSGCGPAGVTGVIQNASGRVGRSFDASYAQVYAVPVALEIRLNPCECDSALEFEANLYGAWRHVVILGGDSDLAELRRSCTAAGASVEAEFVLRKDIYQTRRGQKFHVLAMSR